MKMKKQEELLAMSKQTELEVFEITLEQEFYLRAQAQTLQPSPLLKQPHSIEDFVGLHEIPSDVKEMFWLANNLSLTPEEQNAIQYSLKYGHLSKREGAQNKKSYIRVDCSGHKVKSPCVLEIWPGGHYSPVHEHAGCTGIIKGLVGRVDIMLYEQTFPKLEKLGMLTLSEGDTAWLSQRRYQIHQVYCCMAENEYAATFHVYTDWQKETFSYCEDNENDGKQCQQKEFVTVSHYHWNELKEILMQETPGRKKRSPKF